MKDDNIDIVDLDEEVIYTKKEIVVEKKVLMNPEEVQILQDRRKIEEKQTMEGNPKEIKEDTGSKKEKAKYRIGEKIFIALSILFIIGCCIFYGYRTYYYYHKTHDVVKSISLKDKLTALNNIAYQNDGLYEKDGYFYYKGSDVYNYVYYSGRLFRIIDIEEGKGIRLIEDNNETNLVWGMGTDYKDSAIHTWLTNYLETLKDYDIYLVKNNWCNEKVDVENYECKETIEDYVGLLSTNDYLQAGAKNSYLNNETYFWTLNLDKDDSPLYINNEGNVNNIYRKEDNYFSYGIRPVITINSDLIPVSGDGSKENPYIIEDLGNALLKDNSIGSYVSYNDEAFRILSVDDKGVSLIYEGVLEIEKKYDDVYKYLNNEFIKKFDKKELVKNDYEITEYSFNNKYALNNKKTKSEYIIIPSIGDMFLGSYNGYWLNNYSDSKLGLYYMIDENDMFFSDLKKNAHNIRPIIKVDIEMVVTGGTGTEGDPLIIGTEGDKDAKEN